MPDDSPVLPTTRFARWIAIAVLILFTVLLYFRDGSDLPPITGGTPAPPATTTPAR
jgi:hypothetical protein